MSAGKEKPVRPLLHWLGGSIRRKLLVVLVPGLLLVFSAELWLAWRTASEAADAAYDRSLLGAVKSISVQLGIQAAGLAVTMVWSVVATVVIALVVKAMLGLRVSEEQEYDGMDQSEHGETAYPNEA